MDPLTNLPGRSRFFGSLQEQIRKQPETNTTLAVLVLNINRFRSINTIYGFAVADELLAEVARRITSAIREQDIAGRIGIDEFAVILPGLKTAYLAELAANKLLSSMSDISIGDDRAIDIKASIGIAIYPDHGTTPQALIQQADSALHMARENNQALHIADATEADSRISDRLVADLDKAISKSELELHYQPKVDLINQVLVGAEALIRWDHPELGAISPDNFISIAEENLMIFPLTLWTLNTALRHSKQVRQHWPEFKVAVNLSASLLNVEDLVDLVIRALRTWDTAPGQLMIEVTENAVMKNPEMCLKTLTQLRDHGVYLSIDDFGTGYSSFAYLKKLPVHELKIDQSFIKSLDKDKNDQRIVQSMINLGKNFNLNVIAEGIESEAIACQLLELGCQYGQGYHIGRPMPRNAFLQWIADSKWTPESALRTVG